MGNATYSEEFQKDVTNHFISITNAWPHMTTGDRIDKAISEIKTLYGELGKECYRLHYNGDMTGHGG